MTLGIPELLTCFTLPIIAVHIALAVGTYRQAAKVEARGYDLLFLNRYFWALSVLVGSFVAVAAF